MRRSILAAAAAAAVIGCREPSTGPYEPAGPPPDDLPASLAIGPPGAAPRPTDPALGMAGDSVVASAVLSVSGCFDYLAHAGWAAGRLVLTVTARSPSEPRYCTLGTSAATFRVVVGPVPAGRHVVVFRERMESPRRHEEREVGRGIVTLP